MKVSGGLLAPIFFVILSAPAWAACSVSAISINFGGYDVFQTVPLDSTGTVTVSCDEVPPPDVTISMGQSPNSGAFIPRAMKLSTGPDLLNYNLYVDSARTSVWGDSTGGTTTLTDKVRRNRPWVATAYGRIFPLQDVGAGAYSDSLSVTIVW